MGVKAEMREPMKRFVLLPFTMSCVSQASVAVVEQRGRRSKPDFKSSSLRSQEEDEDGEGSMFGESMRHSSRFSRPNLSNGVNRLMKGFKSLSQLFNEAEIETFAMEMEIGCPTDVKHLTHIGWDNLLTSSHVLPHSHTANSTASSLNQLQLPATERDSLTFGKTGHQMENIVLVPFTMGCVSQAKHGLKRSKSDMKSSSSKVEKEEENMSWENMRYSSSFSAPPSPRANMSNGVNRLMKGFKSLSQLFVYEDEMEEMGMKMEIGCPTNVKHVTHIRSDGFANINPFMEWDKLIIPELLSQAHSVSLNNFKLPNSTLAV